MFKIARALYAATFYLALPYLDRLREKRIRQGKEDPDRIGERKGITAHSRPDGDVVWIHAASVGETISILPLIDAMRERAPQLTVLVTTITVTSAKVLAEQNRSGVIHQYAPLDHAPWVGRFLDYWRPSGVLWVESEFWPNALCMIKNRGIPLILLNGRISPASHAKWQQYAWIIKGMLSLFDLCLAQSETDARYITELGGRNVQHVGNLKLAGPPLQADDEKLAELNEALADCARWLYASSHPSEEALALETHREMISRGLSLTTVIAPRHPERGDSIAEACRQAGLNVRQRSKAERPDDTTDVYVADTVGEMGVFYRTCPVVVMGKSMRAPGGGQNPYEPAKVGCAVLFGPYMSNFVELSADMISAGAARQAESDDQLCDQLFELLSDPALVRAKVETALDYCSRSDTIISDTLDAIAVKILQLK